MSTAALALALAIVLSAVPAAARINSGRGPVRRERVRTAVEDPMAIASSLDILAVCLSAGMAVPIAAAATAPSAPPVLQVILRRAADMLALGADPDTAWSPPQELSRGAVEDDVLSLLRLARRSAASGAALAQGVTELAAASRLAAIHRAGAAAERASVTIAGPLGLCFLPAFVCLGVVPVVAGLAADVFGSGLW